jgi:thioredoxin reductase (NADPH)
VTENSDTYDLLTIGAGPAGCMAALYAVRAGLKAVMISPTELSGMMAAAPLVANFPAQLETVPGKQILQKLRQQALDAGAEHLLEPAEMVEFGNGSPFEVYTGGGTRVARTVVVATGAMAPSDPIPGEKEFAGRGVNYCTACDGPFYQDLSVLVVGQDAEAAREALTLSQICERVSLVTKAKNLDFAHDLAEHVEAAENVSVHSEMDIREIVGDDAVTGARFIGPDGEEHELNADGVFLYVRGRAPATGFLHGALDVDDDGFIITDEHMQTSVAGIYAAGDVRSKQIRQNIVAASEGCIAALAAERFITGRGKMRLDRGK